MPRYLRPAQIRWARRWMTVTFVGLFIFLIGLQPDLIGMDRSPVIGFIQVYVWLVGFAVLLIAAYATVRVVRNGKPNSLRADIGERLIATGYVVLAVASLADFIGVGAQRIPNITFGPVQQTGVYMGLLTCALGVFLYWPRGKATGDPEMNKSATS
jgi:hypothetical protein